MTDDQKPTAAPDIDPDQYYPDNEPNIPQYEQFRRRIFKMISVGVVDDLINQMYDIISTVALIVNLLVIILNTYNELQFQYGEIFDYLEGATVTFFLIDYLLRLYTANCLYPYHNEIKSILKYVFSFTGIVDLLSFLPYYMPIFFPMGTAVFRMFRVARILRLFRINAYYDSLNVITEILQRKKQQLMSSVFIILILMLASSLCMYSIENPMQPDVFQNAFSGIWWAASTLLTVGYGDIYPITTAGKTMGIVIAFLGVGMVAIPTGIISAGFVEQYSRFQKIGNSTEEDVHFIKIEIKDGDKWIGRKIMDLGLPKGVIIAVIQRNNKTIIPRGNVKICSGDKIVFGAESLKGDKPIYLKEVMLKENHPWRGLRIKELDISRQTFIIMIKRNGKTLIPNGNLILLQGDTVILYSKTKAKVVKDEETDEI